MSAFRFSEERQEECRRTLTITGVIFVLFYGTLIGIIIYFYARYKRECREMVENQNTNVNFRLVKKLMAQYDVQENKR